MRIRTRIALALVAVVTLMLMGFSLIVYLWLRNAESNAFNKRLAERGRNTARLLEEVQEVDSALLRIIDRNTLNPQRDEHVLILAPDGREVYDNIDLHAEHTDTSIIRQIHDRGEFRFHEGKYDAIGLHYRGPLGERYIIAYAYDEARPGFLSNLRTILAWGCIIILFITSLTAYFFSARALKPLIRLEQQVKDVNDQSLAHITRVPEPGSRDEIGSLAGSFNDMLRRMQEAFDQQKQFIRYASHELRTPLASVTNQIDLALQQDLRPDEYKSLLLSLQEDHDRLSRLVNQLLLVFRAERAEDWKPEPVEILDVLDQAMEDCRKQFPGQQLEMDFTRLPEDPEELTIAGNAALLVSAIQNLVANACKYGVGEKVVVTIAPSPSAVTMTISNGGPLIPFEERDKIFQPFYRSSNGSRQKGFGLGLLLARKIARLHGGELSYTPIEQLNRFCFTLPRKSS